MKKVFVGLSGGVDSAASAALLVRAGYDVVGVFIKIVLPGYSCSAVEDRQDAMRVAAHLRIPFREIDLSAAYQDRVFAHMLGEFKKGRTPNPDVLCNFEIKFGLFFEYAMQEGADNIATGHYARVRRRGGRVELLAGVDEEKDQSYFLWMVPEAHLAKTLFPVGDKKKSQVRTLAKKFGLPNALRRDSQGLCFLGNISVTEMLKRELHTQEGTVLNERARSIGRHGGASLYTIGQRHGFHTSTPTNQQQPPLYVIAKDVAHNTITVSENTFPKNTKGVAITLVQCNWIGGTPDEEHGARYRYHQPLIKAKVLSAGVTSSILLDGPHYIALGQSLVLYKGEQCLGGGVVDKSTLAKE